MRRGDEGLQPKLASREGFASADKHLGRANIFVRIQLFDKHGRDR